MCVYLREMEGVVCVCVCVCRGMDESLNVLGDGIRASLSLEETMIMEAMEVATPWRVSAAPL